MAGELISREALDRILRRATELQAQERDIGDGLTKDDVLALGQDVGIPSRYLHQALLEEQSRALVPEQGRGGPWRWLAGPERLSGYRVVPGEKATIERALARWMETEESLQVKRRYSDRTTWEPKAGAFASIQRALGSGGRRFALAQAAEVAGQVTPLESGFCHVQLVADVRNLRRMRIGFAALLLGLGAAATGAFLPLGVLAPFAYLPAVVFAPAAALTLRSHRTQFEKIQTALEQVLDRLERGEVRQEHALPAAGAHANPLGRLADELRALMNPGTPPRAKGG